MKSTPPLHPEYENIEDDDVWNIIDAFFKEYGFISHHLESYNTFIEHDIPRIVEGKILPVEVDGMKSTVEFVNVFLEKPVHRQINEELITIYPKQCVDRDISYLSNIYCDIEFTNQHGIKKIYESVNIGAVPAMAKSHLCNLYEIADDKEALAKLEENFYDPGGYFIINGAKKILCNEERTIYNKIYVFVNRKTNPKYDIYAEVRSIGFNGSHNTTTCVGLFHKKNTIGVVIPYIETSELPIGVIFRALGAKSEEEIIRFIFGGECEDTEGLKLILHSLEYSYECSTREAALHFIGKSGKKFTGSQAFQMDDEICDEEMEGERISQVKKDAISYAKHLIENEFLPHVGTDESFNTQKMFYLGLMVKKLIDVKLKRREPDDRDHEAIKRRLTAGIRMANLFNNAFKRLCSEIVSSIDRFMRGNNAVEIKSTIKAKTIKSAMCNAISNNAWGGRGKTPGISQEYDCFNYQSLLANARKDRSPVTAEGGKVEKPRQVHGTHWGNECMSDTPEGKQAGLVKNKAMGQLVTTGSDHFSILEIIKNMNIISFEEMHSHPDFFSLPKIFLNGYPVGVTRFPENVRGELLHLRRSCSIHPEVSISYDKTAKEIYIMTDAGRTCRPLLIVEGGSLKLKKEHILAIERGEWDAPPGNTWSKLLSGGYVEIVDKQEEEFATIVMFPSELENHPLPHTITHCELHPTMAFGVGVNTVPFPDHNQCIFEHELVYMADGTTKKIKDVQVGDRVINFDPATHIQSYTTVVSTFLGPTNKRIYDVVTFSGRCIRATYDHRFMTNKGWMQLEDIPVFSLDKEEKIQSPLAQKSDRYKSFFSPEEILSIPPKITMVAISVEPISLPYVFEIVYIPIPLQKIKEVLSEEDIEPYGEYFVFQDSLNAVRARIVGYALSPKSKIRFMDSSENGSSRKCCFVSKFQNYSDATMFVDDLKMLGYYESSIRSLRENCVEVINTNITFLIFILSCGAEILGKKDAHTLPSFIKRGSLLLKREFLAGYHGGSISKPLFRFDSCTCDVIVDFPDIIILSHPQHSLSNQKFRDDMADLLDDFDILLYVTGKENAYTYRMLSDMDNVIDYSRKIGFRYNRMQTMDLGTISEYYKAKRLEYFTGTFEKWNNTVEVSAVGRSIFVPLFKKEILREDVFIADITTLSSFQSFICGDGFGVHNSPRNTYQSSMGKQAVGIPGSNYMFKTKGNFHVMKYHQKPIVSTKMANLMGFQHQPSGLNAVVFIGTYLGLNQEDSVVINQDSIDRGFMVSVAYLPVDAKIRKDKGEAFEVPSEMECSNFIGNVSKLDPLTGIVREGEYVQDGDILIGKTVTIDEEFSIYSKKKKNLSVRYQGWPGIVHLIQRGIDGQGYEYVRVVVAQERSPIDGDKFCYTPDHDVLTEKGWKNITELEYSDKIATLNEQHEIEYHNPTNIVSFDHEGDVIEIDTNQVSLCVTPNHNLYVKRRGRKEYKLEEAGKLCNVNTLRFKKNGKNTNPDQSTFCLNTAWRYVGAKRNQCIIYPPINVDMDAWLTFYGIWYAEGCVSNNRLYIAINKERVLNKLKELSEILNFDHSISGHTMLIKDIHIRFHLKKLSVGAIHKKLENWVWSLSERQSRILLEGLLLGDGHDNGGTPMYDTSSVQLKDDVMRLALHCGWSANAYVRFPKEKKRVIHGCDTKMNADSWRITIVKKQNEPAINKHIKNQLTKTNYKGKVYCCTVPNNVLYVRRTIIKKSVYDSDTLKEGKIKMEYDKELQKPVWCGNSFAPGQKGTVGYRPRSHELPFNKYGIAPDVMINPLAMPSRMTIGLLIEMICGKMVCSTSKLHKIEVGQVFRLDKKDYSNPTDDITHSDISSSNIDIDDTSRSEEMHSIATEEYKKIVSVYDEKIDEKLLKGQDATPWQPSFKIEDICAELKKLGMNEFSAERMTFGKTGEVQEYLMYEGVCYYQRLKHMVVDKHHARSRGGRVRITHQPLEQNLIRHL